MQPIPMGDPTIDTIQRSWSMTMARLRSSTDPDERALLRADIRTLSIRYRMAVGRR